MAVSASPELVLDRRTALSPASVKGRGNRGNMRISCDDSNTYPTWRRSQTGSDEIVVSSTFTNYDDARPVITATAPLRRLLCSNKLWMGRARVWAWSHPREETPPRPKSASSSGENSASLEHSLGQLARQQLPVNPVGSHSDKCTNPFVYKCMSRDRLNQGLGRNLCLSWAWPRPR
jgi:hypothetical protein